MADTIHCSGCHQMIDISRPADIGYECTRGRTSDGRPEIIITVGEVVVHRCVLCADGEWR